jgi:CRP-like cAMP-binding protein
MVAKLSFATLQKIPLLEGLDSVACELLISKMRLQTFSKSEYVVHKGSRGEDLFFLIDGRLLVVDVTADGRQTGLNFLTPGDFFGELALIDELPRSASIMAVAQSVVAVLPNAYSRQLIYETPLVAERMLRHIALRLRSSTDFRAILSIPHIFQRVCALIHLLAKPDPGQLLTIEHMPTHQHVALMVNSSRETVSRALHVLIEKGILEKDNRRVIIRMPNDLLRLATEATPSSESLGL